MEKIRYKENLASIKDLSSDIDIRDTKWDFLFDQNKKLIFFNGFRLLGDLDDAFLRLINTYASSNLVVKDNYHNIFMRIDGANILVRSGIAELWNSYEYPSFIFLDNENEIDDVSEMCINKFPSEQITERFKDITIVYKSFEQNVLWVSGINNILP
jgi:hypothetical protein